MKDSKIEWTHHTANLWHGCSKCSIACDHCFADTVSKRWGRDIWGNDKPRLAIKSVWKDLKMYDRLAEDAGQIHRVFVGSMMDVFEKPMPLIDSKGNQLSYQTDRLRNFFFEKIIPRYPNLLFLLLTKRPHNINKYIPVSWLDKPPVNVMFGTSVGNQQMANKLIVELAKVNGRRFLSVEPQISAVDLMALAMDGKTVNGALLDWVDWVIVGGESGPGKRPFNTDWARQIEADCKIKGVPYFFKQIDKIQPIPAALMKREFPASIIGGPGIYRRSRCDWQEDYTLSNQQASLPNAIYQGQT